MTTIRSRVMLAAALSLAMAAVPSVSAAQVAPQRGRSGNDRYERSNRSSVESRNRDGDRDDRDTYRSRGDRDDRYEDRRDDRDRDDRNRSSRYDRYSRSDSRYSRGLARSCQVEYDRLIANERRQEAQWYRNHGRYDRNTRKHEIQQRRKFDQRMAQLRRRCGSVSGPWNWRTDVWRGTQLPQDRNGDGRIDSRDRSDARRDQRSDDAWSRARRRSGGS